MAYQLKKKRHINKTLDLIGNDGNVEKTLTVDIIVDEFRNRYPMVMADVKKAQAMIEAKGENDTEAIVASQIAVKAVFVLVFGAVQTKEFLEYYENRYSEAFLDVIPFITDEIIPEVQKAVEEENKRIQSIMK
jgi:hypothetical protein